MANPYVNRKDAERSYRPKGYDMSPGLRRAREPYRVKNAITGMLVAAFAVGVWAYSLRAVNQDVFDDIDEQAKTLAEERARNARETQTSTAAGLTHSQFVAPPATSSVGREGRGLLAKWLENPRPGMFDPKTKTLVWGAPSVDNVGRISDSSTSTR